MDTQLLEPYGDLEEIKEIHEKVNRIIGTQSKIDFLLRRKCMRKQVGKRPISTVKGIQLFVWYTENKFIEREEAIKLIKANQQNR